MYKRLIYDDITRALSNSKIIVIYGPRQVWKTTLCQKILSEYDGTYFTWDILQYRQIFSSQSLQTLQWAIWNKKLIIIDEAQRITNIGINLKIIHDMMPDVRVIATWSASFDLANNIREPLTGRTREYMMYPLALREIYPDQNMIFDDQWSQILRFWLYPEVFGCQSEIDARQRLENIASNYLYKDILEIENIKKSDKLSQLLQLLALQIWNEVSMNELWQRLSMSKNTVERYIDLLEKSFVIKRLSPLARNARNEIWWKVKIYFLDLGIRNAVIQAFQPLELRNDIWVLRENFFVIERRKYAEYNNLYINSYFWRNYQWQEVDYVEESNGNFVAYECKRNPKKRAKLPSDYSYGDDIRVVTPQNILEVV